MRLRVVRCRVFQVVEFGKPSVLLAHPNSMFAAMVAAANAAVDASTKPQLVAASTDGAASDGGGPAEPTTNGTADEK